MLFHRNYLRDRETLKSYSFTEVPTLFFGQKSILFSLPFSANVHIQSYNYFFKNNWKISAWFCTIYLLEPYSNTPFSSLISHIIFLFQTFDFMWTFAERLVSNFVTFCVTYHLSIIAIYSVITYNYIYFTLFKHFRKSIPRVSLLFQKCVAKCSF